MEHKIEYKLLEDLELDLENPRLPSSLTDSNESKIIEYMLHHGTIIELMQSIATNGYFAGEPIVVIPNSDKSKFIVVEGNRRLTALKLLNNPALSSIKQGTIEKLSLVARDQKLSKIPCVVFNNRDETQRFLGFKHIVGVKNWSPLEKARYIFDLKDSTIPAHLSFHEQCKKLAQIIGSRSDYIMRLLVGYELYLHIKEKDFYKIIGLDDTTFTFSNLSDTLNRTHLPKFLGVNFEDTEPTHNINLENLELWTKWLFKKDENGKTVLKGISSQLTVLDRIVNNPSVLDSFKESHDLKEAQLLLENVNEVILSYMNNSKKYLTKINILVMDENTHTNKENYIIQLEELNKLTEDIKIKLLSQSH